MDGCWIDDRVSAIRLLNDEQLLAEVGALAGAERNATIILIASLCELDARKLYREQGFPSLLVYCLEALQLSPSEAYSRIRAARAAQAFPNVLRMLADGSLTLTNLNLLAPHLTESNHDALLQAARFKTSREVREQIASIDPNAKNFVTLVIRLPRETHDKFRQVQDLLRHVIPSGDSVQIFDRAITLLLKESQRRKRIADVARPSKARQLRLSSRHIPAAVRRKVWRRDQGRCAFIGIQGRCPETGLLEFHHVVPFALGGAPTVENIQLRCRTHNQYEAEQEFGVRLTGERAVRRDATGLPGP